MISYVASCIVDILIHHQIIESEDTPLYQYGFEIIISTILTCMITIIAGLIFHCVTASLIYFGLFVILRSICGGYHAKTYFQCNMIFALVTISTLLMFKVFPIEQFYEFHYICIALAVITTAVYAPVENKNKPLNKQQKIYFRIFSMVMVVILSLLSCLLIIKYRNEYSILIDSTLLVVSVSMFITNPWIGDEKI